MSSKNKLIHTPAGFKDIYGVECLRRMDAYIWLVQVLKQFGYKAIKTPTFEYYDLFAQKVGSNDLSELYKFFDSDNSNLVLRPDFTPGVARACVKFYDRDSSPLRLCYQGAVFRNLPLYQGRLKEMNQMGAELIGDCSAAADAEVVAVNLKCLLNTGLKDFRLALGHTGFLRGIFRQVNIAPEVAEVLLQAFHQKNRIAIEETLSEAGITGSDAELITGAVFMQGGSDILDRAAKMVSDSESLEAIDHLKKVYELLQVYGVEDHVFFDMGISSAFRYYTGIIFSSYGRGAGWPLSQGGRYDSLLEQFGVQAPAVGFVIDLDMLVEAIAADGHDYEPTRKIALVVYGPENVKKAISFAEDARKRGESVELVPNSGSSDPEDYRAHVRDRILTDIYFVEDGGKVVKKL